MTTYYRIQVGGQDAVAELTDPERWWTIEYTTDDMITGGVSAMDSIEALAEYLAHSGIYMDDDPYLVELNGTDCGVADHDQDLGVTLVQVDAIISAQPVPDDFYQLINSFLE